MPKLGHGQFQRPYRFFQPLRYESANQPLNASPSSYAVNDRSIWTQGRAFIFSAVISVVAAATAVPSFVVAAPQFNPTLSPSSIFEPFSVSAERPRPNTLSARGQESNFQPPASIFEPPIVQVVQPPGPLPLIYARGQDVLVHPVPALWRPFPVSAERPRPLTLSARQQDSNVQIQASLFEPFIVPVVQPFHPFSLIYARGQDSNVQPPASLSSRYIGVDRQASPSNYSIGDRSGWLQGRASIFVPLQATPVVQQPYLLSLIYARGQESHVQPPAWLSVPFIGVDRQASPASYSIGDRSALLQGRGAIFLAVQGAPPVVVPRLITPLYARGQDSNFQPSAILSVPFVRIDRQASPASYSVGDRSILLQGRAAVFQSSIQAPLIFVDPRFPIIFAMGQSQTVHTAPVIIRPFKPTDVTPVPPFVYKGDGKKRHHAQQHKGRPERNKTYELYEEIRRTLYNLQHGIEPGDDKVLRASLKPETLRALVAQLEHDAIGEVDLLYRIAVLKRQLEQYQAMRWQQMLDDDDDFMMLV